MTTKVQKWGNSLAVRIPKEAILGSGLSKGSSIEIILKKGEVILRPVAKKKKYSLKELVEGITPFNRHEEVDWGAPRGREIW